MGGMNVVPDIELGLLMCKTNILLLSLCPSMSLACYCFKITVMRSSSHTINLTVQQETVFFNLIFMCSPRSDFKCAFLCQCK